MPTIASGNEVEIYVSVESSVTITPAAGYVNFGCSPPSGTSAVSPRKIYAAETITVPSGSSIFMRALGGSATYTTTDLTAARTAAVPTVAYRKAGNLTTGVGADLVFSGAGGAGAGKLNTGVDLLIPANTLVAGTSQIRVRANVRRTGTDASFCDLRFGTTNGTGDAGTGAAIQFNAGQNPQDYLFDVLLCVTAGRLTVTSQITAPNIAGTYGLVTELASLNFAVDNYITLCISGATTGSYRATGYEVQVFQ